jgi:hypothetical protein
MSRSKEFSGVVVYPRRTPAKSPVMVGVWIAHSLTVRQLKDIMSVARRCIGEIVVTSREGAATIRYLIPAMPRRREIARKVAVFLARLVKRVTGEQSILRELKDAKEVGLVLAAA